MKTSPKIIQLIIKSDLQHLKKVELLSKKIAAEMNLSQDKRDNLSIAITEAAGNAISHGNKNEPEKMVTIDVSIHPDHVTIIIKDQGTGFVPDELDDPLDPANIMKESGRGIFIMEALMDKVEHSFDDHGTTITLTMKKD